MSMVNNGKLKKIKFLCLFAFAFLLYSISLLGIPVVQEASASESETEEFEEFYQSFMQMVQEYDVEEQTISTMSANGTVEEEPNYQTRLIVMSDSAVDDYGAVASCHYKNYYYFQYEDYETTDEAYDYYLGLDGVQVMYDYKTTINDDFTTGEYITIDSSSYNSWGWKTQNDYLGANSYLTTLMETVGEANLNSQVVAVLDTGINTSHTLFRGRILTEYARNFTPISPYTSIINASDYEDDNGHGTHVSGIIAEITPSDVMILPLKVLDADGNGYVSYITNAIEYALSVKDSIEAEGYEFKVMNMSIGVSSSSSTEQQVSANATISKLNLSAWVNEAYSQGVLSVVSAGNTEGGGKQISSTPANVSNAIVVSALMQTNSSSGALMYDYSYSDYGPTVDFTAPGTSIKSAWIGSSYATMSASGTSMAAPHVTACVALLYLNPMFENYSFEDLNTLLQENVNRSLIYTGNRYALSSSAVRNNYYGYGIINIKEIGLVIEGEVVFEEVSSSDDEIVIKLSCTTPVSAGQTVEIYYTTDESAESVSSANGTLYRNGSNISISKSTRFLAAAFIKQNDMVVKRSEVAIETFYVGNQDIESAYTISSGVLTQYSGTELSTLVVPEEISGQRVIGVNSRAFSNSPVEVLYLPSTILKIYDYAFDSNTKLTEIHCDSDAVVVGNYAFQRCTNLKVVDIPNITSLGALAFAYSGIEEISLPNVVTIDKNVFSASSLKTIMIGQEIESIGTHTQMSVQEVYGYAGTPAEDFAEEFDAQFFDLTLNIIKDLATQKVVREGGSLELKLQYFGYDVDVAVETGGAEYTQSVSSDENLSTLTLSFKNLSIGNYSIKVDLTDRFGVEVSSNILRLVVVDENATSYTLSYNAGNFDLFVDGELVEGDFEIFEGQTYSITYQPSAGYNINSVTLNDEQKNSNSGFRISNVQQDYKININTIEQSILTVNFNSSVGDVYVDGQKLEVSYYTVDRGSNLTFTIDSDYGYAVKKVLVDGVELVANEDGSYTISDITASKVVVVDFEEAYYTIDITFVNSCGSYIVSNGGNLSNVAFGSSREITISAFDGYEIDFISVDGKIVDVDDGTFVIDEIDSDKNVIVSFKSAKSSFFSNDNSAIFYYFIIFLVLFVVFAVASIVVYFVRKKQK